MINIRNISKKYFGYQEVIHNFSFDIADGEKICIYGAEGSGKTTLLKLIAGLEQPDSGNISIDNTDIREIHLKDRDTVLVFEDLAIPKLKVIKNIIMRPFILRGMKRAEARRKAVEIALKYNLTHILDNVGLLLSSLDAVKLAVARAFMREPKTIIIDNPLRALRITDRKEYFKILFSYINEANSSIIYATDDIEELKYFSGRIIIMEYGYIKQIGTYEELINSPQCVSVSRIINSDNMNFITGKLILRNNAYYALIYDREYLLERIRIDVSLSLETNVILAIPAKNIYITDKQVIPIEINYIKNDKIALVNCIIDNKQLYCVGDTDGKFVDIDMSNINIFDLTTEKTLINYNGDK